MKVIYLLPAHNCANTLPAILQKLPPKSTVVVDDGSNDGTADSVKALGFNCIAHKRNLGVGAALKTGITYALDYNFSHAITIDADGQHPVSKINTFNRMLVNCDFVIGNRFHSPKIVPDSKLSSNLFASLLYKNLFSYKLYDVACGFRGFKLDESLTNIPENGYGFLYRHLVKVLTSKITIKSIKINCVYPFDQPLCTRRVEIIGLIDTVTQIAKQAGVNKQFLNRIANSINNKEDLRISIEGFEFYAYYVSELDSYVFQSIKPRIYDFYDS